MGATLAWFGPRLCRKGRYATLRAGAQTTNIGCQALVFQGLGAGWIAECLADPGATPRGSAESTLVPWWGFAPLGNDAGPTPSSFGQRHCLSKMLGCRNDGFQ